MMKEKYVLPEIEVMEINSESLLNAISTGDNSITNSTQVGAKSAMDYQDTESGSNNIWSDE
jgi:hypothetical protein